MKDLYHEVSEGYGRVSLQREGELTYSMRCPNDQATWDLVKKHLPHPITAEMRKRASEVLGAYLFGMPKKKGKREAYCTACGRTFEVGGGYMHGLCMNCPKCGKVAIYFESWRGRRKCVVANYHAFWAKSKIDNTIFQVGVICERDFANSITAKPEFILADITMFREKRAPAKFHAVFTYRLGYYVSRNKRPYATRLMTGAGYYTGLRMDHFDCNKTLQEAARGTQLERCGVGSEYFKCLEDSWKLYELVALAMRYPSVEYLCKMGQKNLISEVITWGQKETYINLNGKTAKDVLGLTPQVLKEVKTRKFVLYRDILMARAAFDQRNEPYCLDDLCELARDKDVKSIMEIDERVKIKVKRMMNYLSKQRKKTPITFTAGEWRDYLKQCIELGMDISDESITMPKDLHAAHQELTRRVEYKRNAEFDEQIKKRAEKLKEYQFSAEGIQMRPFISGNEIIDEGTALHHCVGGYVKRYADGWTILCALRRAEDPNTPWHTVEFTTEGRLVQCRGLRNMTKAEDEPILEAFWTAFEEHRTKKVRKSA